MPPFSGLFPFGPGADPAAKRGTFPAIRLHGDVIGVDLGAPLQRLLNLSLDVSRVDRRPHADEVMTPFAPLMLRTAVSAIRRWKSQSTSPSSVIQLFRTVTLMFFEL